MVLWWEVTCAETERMGQASHMPEMERAYWLDREVGLGSDGNDSMKAVGGLSHLTLNLVSQ